MTTSLVAIAAMAVVVSGFKMKISAGGSCLDGRLAEGGLCAPKNGLKGGDGGRNDQEKWPY